MRHYVAAALAALTLTACQDATPRASVTEPPREPVVAETTAAPEPTAEVTTPAPKPTPVRVVAVATTKPPAPKPTPAPVRTTTRPPAPPAPTTDPRFGTCREAKANGYGPYTRGVDPEYYWYRDADHDGIDCE
jgi:outer membrane biosynthesis protein TonB